MKKTLRKRIADIVKSFNGGYADGELKTEFHKLGTAYLKALALAMNLPAGSYTVRRNEGGSAVLGEVTLHAENLYFQLSQSAFGDRDRFMYRTCKSQKDYTGGRNHWMLYADLVDSEVEDMAGKLKDFLFDNRAEWMPASAASTGRIV